MKADEAKKNILRQLAAEIKNEYKIAANTAYRVGSALLAIIEALPEVDKLREVFLSRDKEDSTDFLLKFLGGIEVGEFVDSMLVGKGAGIDQEGNAQVESLEVRGQLKVLELIVNKLQAVGGDLVMTESGVIEYVSLIEPNTYRLFIRKNYDMDLLQFAEGDVLRGMMTELSSGQIRHSWLRVLNVNTVNNSISVVSYPDAEVPSGRNYAPLKDMVLHRWGNAINSERQSTWYISSIEGRIVFLDKVTKPILEDSNYASTWGKPLRLKQFEGLPINYDQPYAWMRGLIVQDLFRLRYDGTIERTIIDCGPWEPGKTYTDGSAYPYEQHDVWHHNCRWRCIVPEGVQEPSWNATDWVMISGNDQLSIELSSDGGNIYRPNSLFTANITARVFRGTEDITAFIADADWKWTRQTNNINGDNAWNVNHVGATNKLTITQDDMDDLSDYTKFICTAFVRDGKEINKIEKEVVV